MVRKRDAQGTSVQHGWTKRALVDLAAPREFGGSRDKPDASQAIAIIGKCRVGYIMHMMRGAQTIREQWKERQARNELRAANLTV